MCPGDVGAGDAHGHLDTPVVTITWAAAGRALYFTVSPSLCLLLPLLWKVSWTLTVTEMRMSAKTGTSPLPCALGGCLCTASASALPLAFSGFGCGRCRQMVGAGGKGLVFTLVCAAAPPR